MTLEQYKQQVSEIHEASKNFNGTPEEAVKFFEDLAKKYPEVNEFNAKAMKAKDLDEFKSLADSFGMHFSSDESAEKLFTMLHECKKQLEALALRYKDGAELSDESLVAVTGGELAVGILTTLSALCKTIEAAFDGAAALAEGDLKEASRLNQEIRDAWDTAGKGWTCTPPLS